MKAHQKNRPFRHQKSRSAAATARRPFKYVDDALATKIASEIRAETNGLSAQERATYLAEGMRIING